MEALLVTGNSTSITRRPHYFPHHLQGHTVTKKKLIETSLPLEAINAASNAEKKRPPVGHPVNFHLYWSRKPLAIARAILFAQLVDDPASRPEEFPTAQAQDAERARLHALMEKLVTWENSLDEGILAQAREEILKSNNGHLPPVLDPFAGGVHSTGGPTTRAGSTCQ